MSSHRRGRYIVQRGEVEETDRKMPYKKIKWKPSLIRKLVRHAQRVG